MPALNWWLTSLAALALPTACGGLLVMSTLRIRLSGIALAWSLAAGHFLGLGLTALLMALLRGLGLDSQMLPGSAVGLAIIGALAGFALLRWRRPAAGGVAPAVASGSAGGRVLWWLLLLWLASLLLLAGSEALLRPLYPWDAWSAWSVKARVWAELGPSVDFVSFAEWIQTDDPQVFTNEAWGYPDTLPLVQYWMTQWHGGWDPAAANLPWISSGLALAILLYSSARLAQVSPLLSMIGTFLLFSMPILTTQLALAGYADSWVCAAMVTFVSALLLNLSGGASLVPALAALLLVGSLKLEGVIWALMGLVTVLVVRLPRASRLAIIGAASTGLVLWLALGGFSFTLAGLKIQMTPDLIELPYLGRHPLGFDNQAHSLLTALVVLPNWHLFWLLGLPAMVKAAWDGRGTAAGRGLATLLVLGLGFLFVLFFFTRAAVWAESMTASNRLALHLAPAAGLWAWVLLSRQQSR